MLKLKLLIALIKRNWKIPIYLILTFFILKGFWVMKEKLDASARREHNLKAVIFKTAKGLRTQAQINKDLEGVYLLEQETSAYWKAIALKGSATQTQIDSNRTKVSFDTTDACISLKGFTLTNPAYYELDIKKQPFSIDIKVSDWENNVYSWTSTSPCVFLDTVKLEAAPDVKGAYRDGFDTGEFLLGAGFMGIASFIILLFR